MVTFFDILLMVCFPFFIVKTFIVYISIIVYIFILPSIVHLNVTQICLLQPFPFLFVMVKSWILLLQNYFDCYLDFNACQFSSYQGMKNYFFLYFQLFYWNAWLQLFHLYTNIKSIVFHLQFTSIYQWIGPYVIFW